MNYPFVDESSMEWRAVCLARQNLLLEGPKAATEAVLLELQPHLRAESAGARRHRRLERPDGEGAVILREVSTLTTSEQSRLLNRLNAAPGRSQLVSTSSEPLFAHVESGLFAEALYYKLNVILMRVGSQR